MDAGSAASCGGRGRRTDRAARRRADPPRAARPGAVGAGWADRRRGRRPLYPARYDRHSARLAAADSSTCARRHASGARRNGLPSSTHTRWPSRKAALAGAACATAVFCRSRGFARDRALSAEDAEALLERCDALELIRRRAPGDVATRGSTRERILLGTLDEFHAANPDLPASAWSGCACAARTCRRPCSGRAANACKRGDIASTAPGCACRAIAVRLTPTDESSGRRWPPLLGGQERFRPPRVRDIASALGAREADVRGVAQALAAWARSTRSRTTISFCGHRGGDGDIAADVAAKRDGRPVHCRAIPRPARQRAQGRDPNSRILRSPWRHLASRRCAPDQSAPARPFPERAGGRLAEARSEEKRPRWGVRTSNPGGAASRSLVGSTPSLFRHVQRECNETRAILSPCEAGHRNAKDLRRYPGAKRRQCPGVAPTEAAHVR